MGDENILSRESVKIFPRGIKSSGIITHGLTIPVGDITADAHSVSSIMFFSVLGGTTLLNGILSIIPKSLPKPISMLKGLYLPIALMGLFVGFGGGI